MVLGIKLEIDKASVKEASKELHRGDSKTRKDTTKAAKDTKKTDNTKSTKDSKKDKTLKGALTGGIIGGFVGAIVGSLKPIQELLKVIGGILQIFLVPVLILLKPFLILFLKLGMALSKWLSKAARTVGEGPASEFLDKFKTEEPEGEKLTGLDAIRNWMLELLGVLGDVGALLFNVGGAIGQFFFDKILWPLVEWFASKVAQLGEFLSNTWKQIKDVFTRIKNGIFNAFWSVINFIQTIPSLFAKGLEFIADLGIKIWDTIKAGLSGIVNLGSRIVGFIMDKISSFFGGGSSQSHQDVLITSSGQVHDFSPQDNIMAFKDFSTVANAGGQSGGSNITINVEGFVGDEDTLADKIGRALSKSSKGGIVNF